MIPDPISHRDWPLKLDAYALAFMGVTAATGFGIRWGLRRFADAIERYAGVED